MFRSLNFWLFLVVIACGVSLVVASGVSLPEMGNQPEDTPAVIPNWQTEPDEQTVHLRVLNGTQQSGLARQFSLLVSGRSCVVEGVGNAPGSWPRSVLVNRRLDHDAARKLAALMGSVPVIRQWDERYTEDAVLILGSDFEKVKAALAP